MAKFCLSFSHNNIEKEKKNSKIQNQKTKQIDKMEPAAGAVKDTEVLKLQDKCLITFALCLLVGREGYS